MMILPLIHWNLFTLALGEENGGLGIMLHMALLLKYYLLLNAYICDLF